MTTLRGTIKWFNGKKDLGSLNERTKRKTRLYASAVKAAGRILKRG